MACDLKQNIKRMKKKLYEIERFSFFFQAYADEIDKIGEKYKILSKGIGKIAVLVRNTPTVRDYWYAKFVEDGVLVPNRRRDSLSRQKKSGGRPYSDAASCRVHVSQQPIVGVRR